MAKKKPRTKKRSPKKRYCLDCLSNSNPCNCPRWRTAQGKEMRIRDMSNEHLANTINFLRKLATKLTVLAEISARVKLRDDSLPFIAPEACDPSNTFVAYDDLTDEAKRREMLEIVHYE